MTDDLQALYEQKKRFPTRPVWRERDANWIQCVQALDIDGVTVEGLRFRATALLRRPDESVTFQIEYLPPRRQPRGGPMSRVEWRPLSGHSNKGRGPAHLRNVLQTGTHHHHFHECWKDSPNQVRKGNLDIALPVEPEPSWDEILVFVGKEFRIEPIEWVPFPPWKPLML
jgi:hypothetical protein